MARDAGRGDFGNDRGLRVEVGDGDVDAFGGERQRDGAADAGCAAGDQSAPAAEPAIHAGSGRRGVLLELRLELGELALQLLELGRRRPSAC